MKRAAFIALAVVAVVVACGWNGAVQNPESRDWPCGPLGVVCSGAYPHAVCCWQGDVCGGSEPSCPAGYCCFVGETPLGSPRRMRAQWLARARTRGRARE